MGRDDVIFGNLGQDDIIGGSSSLFSLTTRGLRPDGSDLVFGGAGTDINRNNLGDETASGHADDSDMILGDNGNIYRLVGTNGAYLAFNYDTYNSEKIVPRAAELLDYTIGGPDYDAAAANDIGRADELHGESGDDFLYGMKGSDVLFGEGQDDDLIGGYGNDWISGGTGQDGVLGDDGRIFTSRNSEPPGMDPRRLSTGPFPDREAGAARKPGVPGHGAPLPASVAKPTAIVTELRQNQARRSDRRCPTGKGRAGGGFMSTPFPFLRTQALGRAEAGPSAWLRLRWASARVGFIGYVGFALFTGVGGILTAPLATWYMFGDWRFWRHWRPALRLIPQGWRMLGRLVRGDSGFMLDVPIAAPPSRSR